MIIIKGKTYKYICHVIDHFSGFNIIWAHERKDAKDVVEGLKTLVFNYFGLPKIFHSDNGLEFKNDLCKQLINSWPGTCKVVHGRSRCPWVQGQVEQSNGTLEKLLMSKMKENKTNDWVEFLPNIQYIMNINMQNSTKTTPYDIVFGQNPNIGLNGVFDGGNEEVDDNEAPADHEEVVENEKVDDNEAVDHEEVVESQVVDTLIIEDEATTLKLTRSKFLTQVSKRKADSRDFMSQKHNHKKNKNIHEFEVDDIISVLIPKVDSGHTDFPRLVGKILSVNNQHASSHPSYEIVCEYGVLDKRYYAKDLELYMGTIKIHNAILNTQISLRAAASKTSDHKEPVNISCKCAKTQCKNNLCVCVKAGLKCTSHCHAQQTSFVCKNKEN